LYFLKELTIASVHPPFSTAIPLALLSSASLYKSSMPFLYASLSSKAILIFSVIKAIDSAAEKDLSSVLLN